MVLFRQKVRPGFYACTRNSKDRALRGSRMPRVSGRGSMFKGQRSSFEVAKDLVIISNARTPRDVSNNKPSRQVDQVDV